MVLIFNVELFLSIINKLESVNAGFEYHVNILSLIVVGFKLREHEVVPEDAHEGWYSLKLIK